jgi:density-regulated protein
VPLLLHTVAARLAFRLTRPLARVAVADVPFEFCEFFPEFEKSKAAFKENYMQSFPHINGEEELLELMTRLGFEGEPDDAAKRAQKAKKAPPSEDAPPQPPSKKDKKKEAAAVVIELNTRNKKKFVTCVRGLELFEVDVPAAAKVFGKKVRRMRTIRAEGLVGGEPRRACRPNHWCAPA